MADVFRLIETRRSRFGRWAGAAAIVCGLHVGGAALAFMHWQDIDDSDDTTGGLTVELTSMSAPVPVDTDEIAAIGPDQNAAEVTPEAAKKVVEELQKDMPLAEASPIPDPEVALPKPQPEEKEKPKEKEEAQEEVREVQKPPENAAEFTARLRRVSPSAARKQASWQKSMAKKIERYTRYPDAAQRRGAKGVAVVKFKVDRAGNLLASEVVQSSGSAVLDEEALAVLQRASPMDPPPDEVDDPYLENTAPIYFGVKPPHG